MRDSTIADISGSNGFEVDNDASGSNVAGQPQTAATFSNMTIIGPRATLTNAGNSNFKRALHLRRNSSISIFNSVFMGYPTGLLLDASTGTPTDLNYVGTSPRAVIAGTILAGNNTQFSYTASTSSPTGWTTTDLMNYFNRTGASNSVLATAAEVGVTAGFKHDGSVDFSLVAGSPATTGAIFTDARIANAFFTTTSFRGAAGVGDTWWKVWTSFK
jgi:hypothetical protein